MGLAIIISDADYSARLGGKVTPSVSVPITGLAITDPSAPIDNAILMRPKYSPANTTERGVVWSISAGSQYASIEETSGLLTIKEDAQESSVVVRCVSVADQSIVATKSIVVSYEGPSVVLDVPPLLTSLGGIAFGSNNCFILDAHIDTPSKVGSVKFVGHNSTPTANISIVVADSSRKILSITPISVVSERGVLRETNVANLGIVVPAGGYVGFKHGATQELYFDFGTTDIKTGTDESGTFVVGSTFSSFNYSGLIWNAGFALIE